MNILLASPLVFLIGIIITRAIVALEESNV